MAMEDVKAPKRSNKPLSLLAIILALVAILIFTLFIAWSYIEFRYEKHKGDYD